MRFAAPLACSIAIGLGMQGSARATLGPEPNTESIEAAEHQPDPEPEEEGPETDRERAARLFEEGSSDYTLGNYTSAVGKFEEAYRLSNEPEMLYNLGQAYWKHYDVEPSVDHLRKARVLFKNYQKILGNQGTHSEEVEDFILELEEQIQALGEEVEEQDAPPDQAAPPVTPAPTTDDRTARLGGMAYAGIGLLAVGALGGGGLVTVGLVSRQRLLDQRATEEDDPRFDSARADQYDANVGKTELMTYVSAGIGGALMVTGAVLVAVDVTKRRKGRETARLRPSVTPGGLGLRF